MNAALVTAHLTAARAAGVLADTGLFQMFNNATAKLQAVLYAIAGLAGIAIIITTAVATRFSIPKILAAFIAAGLMLFAVRSLTRSQGTVEQTVKELGGILNPPGLGSAIGHVAGAALLHVGGFLAHLPLPLGWF